MIKRFQRTLALQALKFFGGYGLGDSWGGGSSGMSSRNHDLTFTESGAATAFGIIVEVQRAIMFMSDSILMLPAGIYDSRTKELLVSLDTRELDLNVPGATFIRAVREYERQWLHNYFDRIVFSDWLYGETFVARLNNVAGGVAGLRWLNPLYTTPQTIRGRITHYDYSGDDGYAQIPPERMAYRINHPNPYNDLRGLSPILSALGSMNIGRNAERGVTSYFKNGMILGGVMMPQSEATNLSGPQIGKMQQDLRQHHEGVDNAFRWLIAPTLMSFKEFQQPDLQKNYEVAKGASKKIFLSIGVPPELAGDPETVSYDNADKVMRNWLRVNGKAYANQIASFVNTTQLPYFEPNRSVYFGYDYTQIDQQDAALVQADFNSGLIPWDVAQAQRGYEVDEDLKDTYIIGGKPVHKSVIVIVSRDPAAFGYQTPTPLMLQMPGQPAAPTIPGLPAPDVPALPEPAPDPEPQKGLQSLCVMLDLSHNPDLISLQKRLMAMHPDPEKTIKWNDPSEFHITLLYVPSVDDEQIAALVETLPDFDPEGLSLKLGQLNCFDNVGEHALHFRIAHNESLMKLQAALHKTCKALGLRASGYSTPEAYKPHVTMGYLPEKVSRLTFDGKVRVSPTGMICSVERGGQYETVWPAAEDPPPDPEKSVTLQHGDHSHELSVIQRDYSPEKALAELNAWRNYVTRGKSKRAFEFKHLRGDPADYIAERTAAGDSPGEIFKALAPRFDGSALKAFTEEFALVFRFALSDDIEGIKALSSIESDFRGRFTPVIEAMRDGSISSRQRAGNILRQLIRVFGAQAYREGMKDGGVDADPSEDEQAEINKLIAEQSGYVSNLTSRVLGNGGKDDIPMAGQADTWFRKSILPFYYAGMIAAKGNQMMEFTGEDGEESCETCKKLKGQRHRLKDWNKKELIPRVNTANYECGGWKCLHGLTEVSGKARGSWLGKAA